MAVVALDALATTLAVALSQDRSNGFQAFAAGSATIAGTAVVIAALFLALWVSAPIRQRDEARALLQAQDTPKERVREFYRRGRELHDRWCISRALPMGAYAGWGMPGGDDEQFRNWFFELRDNIDAHLPPEYRVFTFLDRGGSMPGPGWPWVEEIRPEHLCPQLDEDLEKLREIIVRLP